MKIALLGYGKMGKAIEKIAEAKGHEIVYRVDMDNSFDFMPVSLQNVDVAIDFSMPTSAGMALAAVVFFRQPACRFSQRGPCVVGVRVFVGSLGSLWLRRCRLCKLTPPARGLARLGSGRAWRGLG